MMVVPEWWGTQTSEQAGAVGRVSECGSLIPSSLRLAEDEQNVAG